jgi:hypothetical protein
MPTPFETPVSLLISPRPPFFQRANEHYARRKRDGAIQLELGNSHGGLVYLVTRPQLHVRGGQQSEDAVTFRVMGPASAPTFVSSHTSRESWEEQLALAAAHQIPWGELIGRGITFSVPVDMLRKIRNPQQVLDLWDRLVYACQDMVGRPNGQLRYKTQRVVVDVPAASQRHDGYPLVATSATVEACLVGSTKERAGRAVWRLMHMLGHNFQERPWTVRRHEEVTCNLFALYAADTVLRCKWEDLHPQLHIFPAALMERLSKANGETERPQVARARRASVASRASGAEGGEGDDSISADDSSFNMSDSLRRPPSDAAEADTAALPTKRWRHLLFQRHPLGNTKRSSSLRRSISEPRSLSERSEGSTVSKQSDGANVGDGLAEEEADVGETEWRSTESATTKGNQTGTASYSRRRPRDAFLNLAMYQLLVRSLGWNIVREVLREYGSLHLMELPRTDASRVDQLVHRFSRAAESDLAPLFDYWGLTADRNSVWYLRGGWR